MAQHRTPEFWNERYGKEEFGYGTEPNAFFKQELDKLNPGRLLLPGEGEGRNAVYAAKQGWQVDALDHSDAAKAKAQRLAEQSGVQINYTIGNMITHRHPANLYDAAAVIYIHIAEEDRTPFYSGIINSLKPGGTLILEVFEKEQINRTSGGPKGEEFLYSLEEVYTELHTLDLITFSKETLELDEGEYHQGTAEVIRYVGVKS